MVLAVVELVNVLEHLLEVVLQILVVEEVVEEKVGRLVEVGDVDDLERGIAHVLDHYESYDQDAIRRRALERFDYRQIAGRIYTLYEAAISS